MTENNDKPGFVWKPFIDTLFDAISSDETGKAFFKIAINDKVVLEYSSPYRETVICRVKSFAKNGNDVWLIDEDTGFEIPTSMKAIQDRVHKLKLLGKNTKSSLAHLRKTNVYSSYLKQQKQPTTIMENKSMSDSDTTTTSQGTSEAAVSNLSAPTVKSGRKGRPKGAVNKATREKLAAAGHDLAVMSPEEITAAAKKLRAPAPKGDSHRGRPKGSFSPTTVAKVVAAGYPDFSAMAPDAKCALVSQLRSEKKLG